MRLNKKMLAVTAVLAVGILAGCGSSASSTSTASSAASSEPASSAVASSKVEEEGAVEPIEVTTLDDLKNETSAYRVAASIDSAKDGQVTVTTYSYDGYLKEDIDALEVGGKLITHEDGAQANQLAEVVVNKIDRDAASGYVTINGGIEEGGVELTLDHDVYRTVTMDDYPVYYEVGPLTLPLAEDVELHDSSADPHAEETVTTGAADVEAALNADSNWTSYNTKVTVSDGQVSEIVRIWVP